MGNFKITGYVVTGLVESNDSATYVVVYGIRDDEKQAKELFEKVVKEETRNLELSEMKYELQRINEKEIRIVENAGDYMTIIELKTVYEYEKEEIKNEL